MKQSDPLPARAVCDCLLAPAVKHQSRRLNSDNSARLPCHHAAGQPLHRQGYAFDSEEVLIVINITS